VHYTQQGISTGCVKNISANIYISLDKNTQQFLSFKFDFFAEKPCG
jgi:hypothetical protein